MEDSKQQLLRLGDKVINISNSGPPSSQLHLENNKGLQFSPRELLSQFFWEMEINVGPATTSPLVNDIVAAAGGQGGQQEVDDGEMFEHVATREYKTTF